MKLMVDQVEEPKVMIRESSRDAKTIFMDMVLDKVEECASRVAAIEAENIEVQEKFKEEHEDLKIP